MFEEDAYTEVELDIEHGDVFILYTDGINEATDDEGNMFGNARLMEELQEMPLTGIEEVGDEIVRRVQMHMGSAAQRDDICVVCFGRK